MDWLPLIIAAIVGIIIGAIAAYIPFNRRGEEYQYRISDLEGKFKTSDRALNDTRNEAQTLQAGLRTAESNFAGVQDQLKAAVDEKLALDATLQERVGELGTVRTSLTHLETERDELSAKLAALTTERDAAAGRLAELTQDLEGRMAELETYKTNAEATAQALAARDEELEKVTYDLGIQTSKKDDLETRLQRVRAEVAAELAMLTSAAIKLKEDALDEANARAHALSDELDTLKSRADHHADS